MVRRATFCYTGASSGPGNSSSILKRTLCRGHAPLLPPQNYFLLLLPGSNPNCATVIITQTTNAAPSSPSRLQRNASYFHHIYHISSIMEDGSCAALRQVQACAVSGCHRVRPPRSAPRKQHPLFPPVARKFCSVSSPRNKTATWNRCLCAHAYASASARPRKSDESNIRLDKKCRSAVRAPWSRRCIWAP